MICFFVFFFFFHYFILPLLLKFHENGRNIMDWRYCCNTFIFYYFSVDMVGFIDPHKVVVRRSALSAFPNAWNEGESKEGTKSEDLKHQFSQVERDLNLQEMSELVPIPKKSTKEKDNYGILCLCSSILCIKSKKEELKKPWKEREKINIKG